FPNAERCLKPPIEMARLFAAHPQALQRTLDIAHRASGFSLDQLRYEYPDEICPDGVSADNADGGMAYLTQLVWQGAHAHYPDGVCDKVRDMINHELALIA